MILYDIIKAMDKEVIPFTIDEYGINCIPESNTYIDLCFMCEECTWITVNIYSPILIPWYDCEVSNITPRDENTIQVWLKTEEFLEYCYDKYVKRISKEDNNETN